MYFDEDMNKQNVYAYKDHFVHETIMEFNDFKSVRKKKGDRTYYIPDMQELLKYSNMIYNDKQYDDLMIYF